jgi:tetrapyrrole methylase family protein/MazG family protein
MAKAAKGRPRSERLRKSRRFEDLVEIMEILLGGNGCPWDREQTHGTLIKYLKEEAGEVERAVRKKDWENLKEELGDVLLQVVFHSALAAKTGRFDIGDVIRNINSKLVRRHPHVFGRKFFGTPAEVLVEWNRIKKAEKAGRKRK